jgi:hypothetical protein
MRIMIAVLACVIGLAFSAPDATARPRDLIKSQQAPGAQSECEVQQQRRGGRLVSVHRCVTPTGVEVGAAATTCAPRYAHRGHRRVHVQLTRCQPLFA